jgi:hypothetical protein
MGKAVYGYKKRCGGLGRGCVFLDESTGAALGRMSIGIVSRGPVTGMLGERESVSGDGHRSDRGEILGVDEWEGWGVRRWSMLRLLWRGIVSWVGRTG